MPPATASHSEEAFQRLMILADVASTLHGVPDTAAVMEGIADRLRVLLHSPVVMIFVQDENQFQLQAVSTDSPKLAHSIRARDGENSLRSAVEIAARTVAAGERITVAMDGASHLGGDLPPGVLIAAPFRTSRSQGAILVYPRAVLPFQSRGEDAGLGSRRLWRGGHRQRRVVRRGPCPGPGTA